MRNHTGRRQNIARRGKNRRWSQALEGAYWTSCDNLDFISARALCCIGSYFSGDKNAGVQSGGAAKVLPIWPDCVVTSCCFPLSMPAFICSIPSRHSRSSCLRSGAVFFSRAIAISTVWATNSFDCVFRYASAGPPNCSFVRQSGAEARNERNEDQRSFPSRKIEIGRRDFRPPAHR